ncbi:MAG TPA: VOC family protein [Blastocatellia bacterium]|nr:VOC family protein [Blastocatellia bacterium]
MLYNKRLLLFASLASVVIFLAVSLPGSACLLACQSSTAKTFPLELDHILIWVTKGAPEIKALEDIGLKAFGETTHHIGQGTASKVFVFENAYLELIWVDDEQAATKNAARTGIDMKIRAQWKQTGASPFGIGLHYLPGKASAAPFPVIKYWAEWMKPNTTIEFAQDVITYKEPMYFIVPDYLSVSDTVLREIRSKMEMHGLDVKRITRVKITAVEKKLTSTADMLNRNGVVMIEGGKAAVMELIFDGGRQGKKLDLRANLPLVVMY